MTDQETTLAKALEIAITLVNVDAKIDHTYLWTDENKVVHIKEPLLSALQTVIHILRSTSRLDFNGAVKIISES